ncbi:MAG: zf-HC2 domain-containing protein [bacterium]
MRKCSEFSELYTDYIDGALNEEMRAEFDAHLHNCPECAKQLESFKSVITSLHELPVEPLPADFHTRLATRRYVEKRRTALLLPTLGVAAAALIIGILLVQNPLNKPGEELAYNNSRHIEKRTEIAKKSDSRAVDTLAGAPAAPAKSSPALSLAKEKAPAPVAIQSNKVKRAILQKPGSEPMKIALLPKDTPISSNEPKIAMYDFDKGNSLLEKNPSIISKSGIDGKVALNPGEIKSNTTPKTEITNDNIKMAFNGKDATSSIAMAPIAAGGAGASADAMPAITDDEIKDKKIASNRKFAPANGLQIPQATAMMSSAITAEPALLLTYVAENKAIVKIKNKSATIKVNEQNELLIDKTNYLLISQNNKMNTETGIILQKAAVKEKVAVLIPTELVQKKLQNSVNENSGLRSIAGSLDAEIYFSGKFVTILPKNLQ